MSLSESCFCGGTESKLRRFEKMSGIYIQNMEMPTGKVATIEIHPDGSVFTLRGRGIGNAVPVEDMRPVVHSFWVYNPGDNFPYCDNCGMPQDARSDFCHACGADMRKKADG